MLNTHRSSLLFALVVFLAACAAPATSTPSPSGLPEVSTARHPKPADYSGMNVHADVPKYDPDSDDPWQVDLRSSDLTKLDLSKSKADLFFANFDSQTKWPAADKMPADFNWQKIMETGKDPGLGIRTLHDQGVTGKGIGIAIIDQPLLTEHQEYKDRLQLYEEINILPDTPAQMHGAAVTSIAAGKTVGVAPDADLYYIGAWTGDWKPETDDFTWNFAYYAQAVRRILEINRSLSEDHKIRVIAMQVGWDASQAGYEEITAAVREAKAAGMLVVSSNLSETYTWYFQGLGRDPLDDPNQFESYRPGLWWEKDFYDGMSLTSHRGKPSQQTLLVPMDSRTTASPTGVKDYVFYRSGGWSWSIPYLAGMYALAAQVKPGITPEEFWKTALKTGRIIQLQRDGKEYEFGVILDPQALIAAIKPR
ncbi:MAG TPA: S8 family serine peptidase [Anaerolineales bacterium]|nr:S8 family serine peptidase [Anaerolineales bacterium]